MSENFLPAKFIVRQHIGLVFYPNRKNCKETQNVNEGMRQRVSHCWLTTRLLNLGYFNITIIGVFILFWIIFKHICHYTRQT